MKTTRTMKMTLFSKIACSTAVMALLGVPAPSQAQEQLPVMDTQKNAAVSEQIQQIYNQIDGLTSQAENMKNQIVIRVQEKNISFPEYYDEVYPDFVARAKTATDAFKLALLQIKNDINNTLSKETSDLAAFQKAYDLDESEFNHKLLVKQEQYFKEAQQALRKRINEKYQQALVNEISLNRFLVFPVKHPVKPGTILLPIGLAAAGALFWWGLPVFTDAAAAESALLQFGRGAAVFLGPAAEFGLVGGVIAEFAAASDDCWFIKPNLRNNLGEPDRGNCEWFRSALKDAGNSIFQNCKTGGCVFKIEKDYQEWNRKATELNQDLILTNELTLHSLHLPKEKRAARQLKRMANLFFKGHHLPNGVLTANSAAPTQEGAKK